MYYGMIFATFLLIKGLHWFTMRSLKKAVAQKKFVQKMDMMGKKIKILEALFNTSTSPEEKTEIANKILKLTENLVLLVSEAVEDGLLKKEALEKVNEVYRENLNKVIEINSKLNLNGSTLPDWDADDFSIDDIEPLGT